MQIQDLLYQYRHAPDHLDTELIIAHSLKRSREWVLTYLHYQLTDSQVRHINYLIQRRLQEEPLAYILGFKEFYGLKFQVNHHTLIPRPETEIMVDLALQYLKNIRLKNHPINILDLGTGSGNIIIALAKNILQSKLSFSHKEITFQGTDISLAALEIAKKNARFHKVDQFISFTSSDLLNEVDFNSSPSFNLILANLPYLSSHNYQNTPITVKKYEPHSALHSPQKGLNHYIRLFNQIKNRKLHHQKLSLILEFSPEQKKLLEAEIAQRFSTAQIKFYRDLSQRWRVVHLIF